MRPTLKLGTLSGINVGVHWSIAVIAFLLISTLRNAILPDWAPGYSSGAYLFGGILMAVMFLGSIVAHEMGHSLVARRNGIEVRSVTLFALGGVAALESEPRTPGAAARVALAGPGVSAAVAALSLGVAWAADQIGASTLLVAGLAWLGVINGMLAVFNMLPALPLDGGRVWQAIQWRRKGNQLEATIAAARLGRWIGWAMVLFGLWQFTNGGSGLWTALIGWFIIASAKAEAFRARLALGQQVFQNQFQMFFGGPGSGRRPQGPPPWFDPDGAGPPPPPGGPTSPPSPGRGPIVEGRIIEVDGRPSDEVSPDRNGH